MDTNIYTCAKELRSLLTEQRVNKRIRSMLSDIPNQSDVKWDSFQEYSHNIDRKVREVTTSLLGMWDGNHNLNTLMTDGMCFIRYRLPEGMRQVLLTPTVKDRLDIVKRHLSLESDITEELLQSNLELVRDWDAWGVYLQEIDKMALDKCKQYVSDTALKTIKELFSKEKEPEQELVQPAGIHAVERYIERILGITDPAVVKHESVHRFVEYKEKIENMYKEAEVLFKTKGKVYKITKDNVILAYKENDNKIMTLYKKDFGFTEEINRQIIFMQIDVIKNEKAKLEDIQKAYKKQMSVYYDEEKEYRAEIEELQAKLDKANAKLNHVLRCKKSAKSMMEESENSYQEEYDKIFKACKVVRVEE
ncbi:hypothetical protein CampHawk_33 [Bacillus phage CampHawk]|uniref:Uncharacterized protein n=2 Tax=Okubovirus camphawk TaxID=1986015 RepID=U5PT23_9CAUD|nr:hypothetical protein CampHawk_33 [Bacillus phage CampHawk]AGY46911.1 hypothetical protein CampHawk_33 [Bacillus phage CampHawk]APZ82271.1 hypothetical protein Goe2_c03100 [Bacillus phage vB_BsuM-Goe2]WCS68673.1 hypothetical protein Goe19_00290 [Bacillus phage vB_BsuM-Goe19]